MAWEQLAQLIVGAATRNMKETKSGGANSEKGYGISQLNLEGMRTQQAPAQPSGANSPTANIMGLTTGMSPMEQKRIPMVGDALKGEEMMLSNQNIPSVGGYMVQPKTFNSSVPFYRPRRMY